MQSGMLLTIAVASTAICLFLWFRDARRILRERKSMVDSAAGQLASCRQKAAALCDDPEVKAVLKQSEKIYRQAVDIYNQTISKPWNYLPAVLMGFRPVGEAEDNKERWSGI